MKVSCGAKDCHSVRLDLFTPWLLAPSSPCSPPYSFTVSRVFISPLRPPPPPPLPSPRLSWPLSSPFSSPRLSLLPPRRFHLIPVPVPSASLPSRLSFSSFLLPMPRHESSNPCSFLSVFNHAVDSPANHGSGLFRLPVSLLVGKPPALK